MRVTLRVRRFNPETDLEPRFQEYTLDLPDRATVLDALITIRERVDGTLAFRYSCRMAVCGACGMRINGLAGLACNTILRRVAVDGAVTLEPMGNMPVAKDLVVNMEPFWHHLRAVKPYVEPHPDRVEPQDEYRISPRQVSELWEAARCIMCGACFSECTVDEIDINFLGPAALARAGWLVRDPRDSRAVDRLRELSRPNGIWDCTRCFYCVQVCPKDVNPLGQILRLRRLAVEAGITDNSGARHGQAFAESVKETGWLDEFSLVPKSWGWNPVALLSELPTAVRMLVRKGAPLPVHPRQPGAREVRYLFEKIERSRLVEDDA